MSTPAIPPLSAQEKIAKLRATFLQQLPARLVQIRDLCERLKANPADHAAATDLHRQLHNLKGTSRSFGFRELGAAAAQGENLLAEVMTWPAEPHPDNWQKLLDEQLAQVERAAQDACSSFADEAPGQSPAPKASSDQPATRSGGRTVYICDDEMLLLEQLNSQLGCFGYKTTPFTEPQALHDTVLTHWPDAVIMDIDFPQGKTTGIEALAALQRKTGKTVPTIFLSSRNDFAARLRAVQAGGGAYFHKPTRTLELVAALDELTRQQKPEPYRILVVDDEPEIAGYHCVILQEAGMMTSQVSEPSRVLEVLQEYHPDMVLMDMYMPECTGHDLARLIRQVPDYVGLPIVFLSSETDRQKQFSALRVGAEGFLTKPVVPEDLVAAVATRAERMRTLRSLMMRDSLTGLFNHTTTTQFLENALATADRGGANVCFVMIDIDRFKLVNDTHGHPVGDQVILALSRVLQQRLRNSDIVGRYGGEEFAIILQNVPLARAAELIDELRQDFSRVLFRSVNGDFSCTFSAGIAGYPTYRSVELLREAADKALYEAKHSGRNRVALDGMVCLPAEDER
ncbi:MAG: hypothetical protein BWK76_13530 [Desulfobulbaceae bacterium A2]|nr:MAG: hypothetical protein BWK76_13530 [Desulfobulbaceae bacterium A2]